MVVRLLMKGTDSKRKMIKRRFMHEETRLTLYEGWEEEHEEDDEEK